MPDSADGLPRTGPEIKKETNPFTEGDWRMLAYAWLGMLVRVVLVLGAFFTLFQYLAAQEQSRLQRAFEMVEMWEEPEYQAAQRALRNRVDELTARYAAILDDQPTANARSVVMRKIGQEAMTADGGAMPAQQFREEVDRIVYFLNRIAFCVEGGICSRKVIDVYFADFARSFWTYFAGYVETQRKGASPNFARPLERYVAELGDDPGPQ